jgi:NAD(P)-dependent dehydrogenase (short-subunit alcohol dehydrogenase family)
VAIVTGGGRGIGRAHCLELAGHGAAVVVVDPGVARDGGPDASAPADGVVAEIEAAGGRAVADHTSVTDYQRVADLVGRTVERFGRLDVVVNNAGILRDGAITELDEAGWGAVISVHLTGTFNLMRHACGYWRERAEADAPVAGRVINTTSGAGLFANMGQVNYSAAKAGIAALTLVAAQEMAPFGVTVNAISPIARTRMTEESDYQLPDPDPDGWDAFDPANSSSVVAWLASADSGWLTGAVLRIEGDTVVRVNPWAMDSERAFRPTPGQRVSVEHLAGDLRDRWEGSS